VVAIGRRPHAQLVGALHTQQKGVCTQIAAILNNNATTRCVLQKITGETADTTGNRNNLQNPVTSFHTGYSDQSITARHCLTLKRKEMLTH
jgi:hypothetical protein